MPYHMRAEYTYTTISYPEDKVSVYRQSSDFSGACYTVFCQIISTTSANIHFPDMSAKYLTKIC